MKRGGPPKRRKPLARGDSELKRSPLARGSSELKRTELARDPGYRIPQRSKKREGEVERRREVVAEVIRLANYRCQYRAVIWEIPCGYFPDRRALEVDELRGGSWRSTEYLDPKRCRATCPAHHDWKTDHKLLVLDRLERLEGSTPCPGPAPSPSSATTSSGSRPPSATTSRPRAAGTSGSASRDGQPSITARPRATAGPSSTSGPSSAEPTNNEQGGS